MADRQDLLGEHASAAPLTRMLLALRVDPPLLLGILSIAAVGMGVLYSAGGQSTDLLVQQGVRLAVGLFVMLVAAQIPPRNLRLWTPWLYAAGVGLLVWVLLAGEMGGGAQRWIDLGVVTFQPSEGRKIARRRPRSPVCWSPAC